jgi:hypothetical protein
MYRPSSPGLRLFLSGVLCLLWFGLAPLTQASTPTTAAPGAVVPPPRQPSSEPHPGPGKQPEEDKPEARLVGLMRQAGLPDVKLRIARNLRQVRLGTMSPEQFYKALAQMDMPKEARFFLMEVRKDIGNLTGQEGLRHFLGPLTEAGGSLVETTLLTWRRQLVMEGVRQVIGQFKGKNRLGGYTYRVYYAEIGSWATEVPHEMKFAGDIDFNFVSGNLDLAWRMKQAFDQFILDRIGMSAQQLDTVCSAHGMAEPEVYVGTHGKLFAERLMEGATGDQGLRVIDLDAGILGGRIDGQVVLQNIAYDARHQAGEVTIPEGRQPTEPGISMEMIRHFLHDIMHNPVFSDMDAFIKAAKYTQRSNNALEHIGQQTTNQQLKAFVDTLMNLKKAGAAQQVDAIRHFFGGHFPWQVELGPTQFGKSRLTIKADETLIRGFWQQCLDTMWDNARRGLEVQLGDFRSRLRAVSDEGALRGLRAEMQAVINMVEIEFLLFDGPNSGARVDPGFRNLVEQELKPLYKEFMQTQGTKLLDAEAEKAYRFLEALLKRGDDWNVKMAMAELMHTAGRSLDTVNTYLDLLDDKLLGELRGESRDWHDVLTQFRKQRLAQHWGRVFATQPLPQALRQAAVQPRAVIDGIEGWMNQRLYDNAVARKIKGVNLILGESIQSSAAGRATMKGMIAMNLAHEIPAYVNAYRDQGWEGVATEFFRRRVPFGSVADHAIMGRYGLAAWDTLVTFVPPLALFQVAASIGAETANQSWRLWWSTELDLFVDTLYESAAFKLTETERLGDNLVLGVWRLAKVTYRDQQVDLGVFAETKREQIDAMLQSLRTPHSRREFPIEYKYEGLTGWMEVDNILRQNLVQTDNLLLMLHEMKKHPSVGPKLLDHLRDVWYTRWEQVKLNFILKLIITLEERRKTEQATLSGKFEAVVPALMQTAEKLHIKAEIEAALEDALGNEIFRFFKWLRDRFVGLKREFYGQADVWDEYEEGTRVLIHYLEVYTRIVQAREQAEAALSGPPTDNGLRLLTGPYFLAGKADQDLASHTRWRDLPSTTRSAVQRELLAIKNKYVSGAALETPFDQSTLAGVVRHDIWKEAWKHVNAQGIAHAPGAWEVFKSSFGGAETPGDRNVALERFRTHTTQRHRLVTAFEAYYRRQAAEERRAEERQRRREDMVRACSEATTKADEAATRLSQLTATSAELLQEYRTISHTLTALEQTGQEVQGYADQAREAAVQVVEARKDLETLADAACTKTQTLLTAGSDIAYRPLLRDIRQALRRISTIRPASRKAYDRAAEAAATAKGVFGQHQALPQQTTQLAARFDQFVTDLEAARTLTEEARSSIAPFTPEAPAPPAPQAARSARGEGQACVVEIERRLTSLDGTLAELHEQTAKARIDLASLHDSTRLETLVGQIEDGSKDAAAAADTAEIYSDALDKLASDAGYCAQAAIEAVDKLVARLAQQTRAAIDACRFTIAAQSLDRLPPGSKKAAIEQAYQSATQREERTRALFTEANAAYQACRYDQALARLNDALAHTQCESYRQSLQQKLAKVRQAEQHEGRTRHLFEQANAAYQACRYDQALARLNDALAHTRCASYVQSLRQKIVTVRQTSQGQAKAAALFKEANHLYKACRFDEAAARLAAAIDASVCAAHTSTFTRAQAKITIARDREATTLSLISSARDLTTSCSFDEALSTLNDAMAATRCERHRSTIKRQMQRLTAAQEREQTAQAVLRSGDRLASQTQYPAALSRFEAALQTTVCARTRAALAEKIATIRATVSQPGAAQDEPPGAPEAEEAQPYYVVFRPHLPWPTTKPNLEQAPPDADKATKKRIAERNKRTIEAFARNLTLAQTAIQAMDGDMFGPIIVNVTGGALPDLPRSTFETEQQYAMGFKGNFTDSDGKRTAFDGAFLLTSAGTFDTYEQVLSAYPKVRERLEEARGKGKEPNPMLRGFTLDSPGATSRLSDERGSATLGPLEAGWSDANRHKSLALTKMLLTSLGTMFMDCFVATAVYGDPAAPELDVLRRFRDLVLLRTEAGRRLVRAYYRYGPDLARWVKERPTMVGMFRSILDRVVVWLEKTDMEALSSRRPVAWLVHVVDRVLTLFVDPDAGGRPARFTWPAFRPDQLRALRQPPADHASGAGE